MDRYTHLERLAVGGMSEVFLARQRGEGGFSRIVVIKQLLPSSDEGDMCRLLDEARLAAAVAHENVVTIFDVGMRDDKPFVAMEYVHGVAASALVRGPASFLAAARTVQDAARGLHRAHTATSADGSPLGIVHRDVAPKNILVRVDGIAKIADFGIAKATERLSKTMTGAVPGTLAYMAPEHAKARLVTPRSDQFALGVCLWELLVGRRLFKAPTQRETVRRLFGLAVPKPSLLRSGIPGAVDAVAMRMLERDPEKRFATMNDVVDALEEALPGLSGDIGRRALAFAVAPHSALLAAREARLRESGDATEIATVILRAPRDPDEWHTVTPATPRAMLRPRSRRSRLLRTAAAAAGALSVAGGLAFACVAHRAGDDDESLTRAYIASRVSVAPLLVRAEITVTAQRAEIPDARARVLANELADIAGERIDVEARHWKKDAAGRANERVVFERRLARLDDDVEKATYGLPQLFVDDARGAVDGITAVPVGFLPAGAHRLAPEDVADARAHGGEDLAMALASSCSPAVITELKRRLLERLDLVVRDAAGDDVSAQIAKLDDDTKSWLDVSIAADQREAAFTLWRERFRPPLHSEPEPVFD